MINAYMELVEARYETLFVIFFVISALSTVFTLLLAKSIARNTGVNLYSGSVRKVLMVLSGVGGMFFLSTTERETAVSIGVCLLVASFVILLIINIMQKVKIGNTILLTVLEILSGFLLVYKWIFGLIFKILHIPFGDFLNFDNSVKKAQQEYCDKNLHADKENF